MGLGRPDSFLDLFCQCQHVSHISPDFTTSRSLALCNPQAKHGLNDTVSIRVPASALSAKSDEKILALFTKGFFGGWVFCFESVLLRWGLWKVLPVGFTGTYEYIPPCSCYCCCCCCCCCCLRGVIPTHSLTPCRIPVCTIQNKYMEPGRDTSDNSPSTRRYPVPYISSNRHGRCAKFQSFSFHKLH
jgi:hypothetical protein